jgi:hypothetical protein
MLLDNHIQAHNHGSLGSFCQIATTLIAIAEDFLQTLRSEGLSNLRRDVRARSSTESYLGSRIEVLR